MTTERAKQAAHLLEDARLNTRPIAGLPAACLPRDIVEAYAIQDAIASLRGRPRGWKFTQSPPRQCAMVFAVEASGVTLEAAQFHDLGVEIEFAFRLTEDMPPRAAPYEEKEVLDRFEFVPLIEIIASRYIDRKSRTPMEILADSMNNGAFIIGAPIADWRQTDFSRQKVELAVNGQVVQSVTGSRQAGSLLDGAVWLANHLAGRIGGFRAGDVVTTGALKGASPAGAGDKAIGDWGSLGRVEVRFR